MTWGSKIPMLLDLAKAGTTPPALKNRPILTPWQQTFMEAFNTLSSSRNYTAAGVAHIPYPYLLAWLDEHQIFDLSDREEFVLIVQAIDNCYVSELSKSTSKVQNNE